MALISVPVKFTNEDTIYTIRQSKIELNCHVCDGTGKINYNEKNIRCPECNGVGKFKSEKQVYIVCDDPFVIKTTKISVHTNGEIQIKYKGYCGNSTINRAEENLFYTKEEAQIKCDELNTCKVYMSIDSIVIPDEFRNSNPSIEKIQEKLNHYKNYKSFKKHILVNNEKVLQDGYINYLICKILNINTIKVVVE